MPSRLSPVRCFMQSAVWVVGCGLATNFAAGQSPIEEFPANAFVHAEAVLPDSPGALLHPQTSQPNQNSASPKPCAPVSEASTATAAPGNAFTPMANERANTLPPCKQENPFQTVVNSTQNKPLTPNQKGLLTIRGLFDPFNLLTIAGESALNVATNAHGVYGPGFKGWGRETGYDFVQDSVGSFFGGYAIPVLAHEDPRYRRMEGASIPRRVLHAVSRTIIAQHDDGRNMPNYATLLTYPITAEISNLYVPGIQPNAPDTAKRIALGILTDPIGNLLGEFLPDVAKRIHVRSVFVQQIIYHVTGTIQSSPTPGG